jgi:flagellar protein FlaG
MSMEIGSVVGRIAGPQRTAAGMSQNEKSTANTATGSAIPVRAELELDTVVRDLAMVTQTFNRRLKFDVNEELGQVVVKVIDSETDKVIKELPPQALQRLHIRIREAIGLLIDEEI